MPQDPNGKRVGKIVVADDMAPLLDTLAETLRTDGYEVFSAADGEVAMALVRSESPDLVLTDINMPSLNGIDLCRQLKEDPATRLIPVMLLTGLDGRAERLAGIDAGADDFLTKPVNTSELRARVRSLMRLKRFTDELDSAEEALHTAHDQHANAREVRRLAEVDPPAPPRASAGRKHSDAATLRHDG